MCQKETLLELRREVMEKEFSRMNDRQKEAVFHVNGPLLILAGAGSGKTTVLVNRIASLVRWGNAYESPWLYEGCGEEEEAACRAYLQEGTPIPEEQRRHLAVSPCPPWRILAITFTNKAAGELKDRLCAMLGQEGEDIWASTFHSTCARILRRDGDRLGYTSHFTIYDTDDSRRLMKECLKSLGIEEKMLPVKAVLGEISRAKDSLISPEEFTAQAGLDFRLSQIAKAYTLYQKRLRDADAMDFDDLIFKTVELFQECPQVLAFYQDKFRYLMVDEYQDTNHAQYLFVRLLAEKSGNLCVVGDDDQSIYKFRGATIENIMSFEKTFPDAKVIRLEQNYRSTQTILDAANGVISHNTQRKGKTLWTGNGEGKKIAYHTADNEQDEAAQVTKRILEGVAAGRKYSDFAILYRMNSMSNTFERDFVRSDIPYRIIGGIRFYERREIRDMIAYLSVINNPADEVRLRRILNTPKRSIGERTVAQATEIAAMLGEPLFEVLRRADEFAALKRAANKLKAFTDMMQGLIDDAQDETVSLGDLYQNLLEQTQYREFLQADDPDSAEDRIENIQELASNLIQYEENNEGGGGPGRLFGGGLPDDGFGQLRPGGGFRGDDDHALRQGVGIPRGVPAGHGRRGVPGDAVHLQPGGGGRGAASLLCGHHPGQGRAGASQRRFPDDFRQHLPEPGFPFSGRDSPGAHGAHPQPRLEPPRPELPAPGRQRLCLCKTVWPGESGSSLSGDLSAGGFGEPQGFRKRHGAVRDPHGQRQPFGNRL